MLSIKLETKDLLSIPNRLLSNFAWDRRDCQDRLRIIKSINTFKLRLFPFPVIDDLAILLPIYLHHRSHLLISQATFPCYGGLK